VVYFFAFNIYLFTHFSICQLKLAFITGAPLNEQEEKNQKAG